MFDLVSLPARQHGERLIGLVESVEERPSAELHAGNGGAGRHAAGAELSAMLIGTLEQGPDGDQFRRGAGSFPSVGSECHLIKGDLLRSFMSVLCDNVAPDERLELGRFVAERSAVAVADGNRLFQRHAGLIGSTGTGKSWTIALMLERASRLGIRTSSSSTCTASTRRWRRAAAARRRSPAGSAWPARAT